MLNISGESGHPCLVLDFRGNDFNFSPLRNVCCGFIIHGFCYVEVCSFYACFLEGFYHKSVLNFVKGFFYIYWDNHMVFIFQFVNASLVAQRLKHLPAMWETLVLSLPGEDPLENERATHSSILAWRIPWREEPGRLQSMGLQRVGHDWAASLHFTSLHWLISEYWRILASLG